MATQSPSATRSKEELLQVDCAPECGFRVRDHNRGELVRIVQMHVRDTHHKSNTEQEILEMAKPVRA